MKHVFIVNKISGKGSAYALVPLIKKVCEDNELDYVIEVTQYPGHIKEICQKYSDEKNHLKLDQIVSLLEKEGVNVSNRKTLYDDFKILNEMGLDIEYENGYYLLEAPFNLSEIKIIQDSICSLRNLDDKLLNNLNNKLYSFISIEEEKLLEKLKYSNKHKDRKLIHRMQDILFAI